MPNKEFKTLYSLPVDTVFRRMMQVSDNMLAEQLLLLAGGKYSDSLIQNAEYLLIDFRQKVNPRLFRANFMYVQFSANYSHAIINSEGNLPKTITLIA